MGPRILVVNQNWIGDVLFSTPALRAIRKKFPDAFLACWVPPRCREILENNPALDDVIVQPEPRGLAGVLGAVGFVRTLRSYRFDTAIFFHRSQTKTFLVKLAMIHERIGYATSHRQSLLTQTVLLPDRALHKTDTFLHLLNAVGIESDGRTPDFFSGTKAEQIFEVKLREWGVGSREPYVVVHAGGNWALKRWPVSYFVEWIKLFIKEYPWRILLCGTDTEKPIADEIATHFSQTQVISLCGKTSLATLALLLKNAKFLLSNDSGPIHLAASQGTKIIGLFGPTSPELTGPISGAPMQILRKDVGCQVPCYFRSCHYRVCMEWTVPKEVLTKAKELLA